jgi:hypothetical protein
MKAHYRTPNGRLVFEVEGAQAKDIFERISHLQDIFESEMICGCCGGGAIRMVCRRADSNKYYELKCLDCSAQFSFGQLRQGGDLFPRRRDKDGNALPDHGWSKWEKPKPQAAPAPSSRSSGNSQNAPENWP